MAEPTTKSEPVVVVGAAGFNFNIHGEGFGTVGGVITVGGFPVKVTSWSDTRIKGLLPVGVKGEVVLTTGLGVIRRGTFPIPAPPLKAAPVEEPTDMRKQFEAFMRSITAPAPAQPAAK